MSAASFCKNNKKALLGGLIIFVLLVVVILILVFGVGKGDKPESSSTAAPSTTSFNALNYSESSTTRDYSMEQVSHTELPYGSKTTRNSSTDRLLYTKPPNGSTTRNSTSGDKRRNYMDKKTPNYTESDSYSTTSPPNQIQKCPIGWHYFAHTNDCYFVGKTADWHTARGLCALHQSNLTSIHSYAENGFVTDISNKSDKLVWIGLYDHNQQFQWIDDTEYNFSNFRFDSDFLNESCVHIACSNGRCRPHRSVWTDEECREYGNFVCKKASTSAMEPTTHKCPVGWDYFAHTEQCYHVGIASNWQTARMLCTMVGAHLVSIYNNAENGFVADISDPENNLVWIGYNNLSENSWSWIDDTKAPSDFEAFEIKARQEHGEYQCASMGKCQDDARSECSTHRSLWSKNDCTATGKFVCKKAPR